jgi:hypothetical protein
MATPLGHIGFAAMPEAKEPAVVAAMKDAMRERKIYFVPGADMSQDYTAEEFEQRAKLIEAGPSGFLVWEPGAGATLGPKTLGTELMLNLLESMIVAFVIARVTAGYLTRVFLCALIGLSATLTVDGSYWNWYHFPTDYFVAQIAHNTIGALLAGLAIAKIAVRRG